MKVKIIRALTCDSLESQINSFFGNNINIELLDIKYSNCISFLSAMIIYKT